MGYIKLQQDGDRTILVADAEAIEVLRAMKGDLIQVEAQPDGTATLTAESRDVRLEKGRAFINRYRKTFEALAK